MLQTARIQVRDIVVTRMVPLDPVGKGEVERGKFEHRDLGEIGVIGQCPIDRRVNRSRRRVARTAQRSSGVEIARARLEHERTPAGTAGLEVENDGDIFRPRMLAHECGRAEEARFLAIGEQRDDRVRQWPLLRPQRAERFEQRG